MKILKDRYIVEYFYEKQLPINRTENQMNYKVKWLGYPILQSTFEPMDRLKQDGQDYFIQKFQQQYQYIIKNQLGISTKKNDLIEYNEDSSNSNYHNDSLDLVFNYDSDPELQTDSSSENQVIDNQQTDDSQNIVDIDETDSEPFDQQFQQFIDHQQHILKQGLKLSVSGGDFNSDRPLKVINHRYCKFIKEKDGYIIQPLEPHDIPKIKDIDCFIEFMVLKIQWKYKPSSYCRFAEVYFYDKDLIFEYLAHHKELVDYFVHLSTFTQTVPKRKIDDVIY